MTQLDDRLPRSPGARWPDLVDVPSGPRTHVSAVIARRLFESVARRLDLAVVTPTATPRRTVRDVPRLSRRLGEDRPTILLHRPDEFYRRIGRDGLIGFGESYLTGAWDSPDLARLLTVLAAEIETLVPERLQRLRGWYVARHPHHHRNSVDNTRGNIAHHYDLSNDLFRAFLDETMTYSSALFDTSVSTGVAAPPDHHRREDLAAAQLRKIDRLLDVTGVGEGTRLLEIGTGWGELALRAARRGAHVHSVTLSREQQSLARERIRAAGLTDRVDVELTDYRRVRGEYDAVVSVEMIEAVGHEYLPDYFRTLRERLAPGGRAGIQAILMPHQRMLATLGTHTWIHKYIFPGGFLPSAELVVALAGEVGLAVTDRLSFGLHYAETLQRWDEAFLATDTGLLGFDETFRRMWHFYLTYCRAGFAAGYLDVQQLVLEREAS
jgi:cyclopropane-fatty-acyl-phospholipid synthase